MKNRKLLYLLYASLFAALVFVATMIISIPTLTGGYVNIGDGLVLLCGWILGPFWGALAAGIGSMLADLVGFPVYAIPTLIIKALMPLLAFYIAKLVKPLFRKRFVSYIVGGAVAELLMITGYFVFEATFMGFGWGALASVLPNVMQGIVGVTVATVLMTLFDRTKLIEKVIRRSERKK